MSIHLNGDHQCKLCGAKCFGEGILTCNVVYPDQVCLDCWPKHQRKKWLVGRMFLTFERAESRTGRVARQRKALDE